MSKTKQTNSLGGEGARILAEARQRAEVKESAREKVDYEALNKLVRRQRAELTRALSKSNSDELVLTVRRHVREWREPGMMWPDDWSRWQQALDDSLPWGQSVDIADLG